MKKRLKSILKIENMFNKAKQMLLNEARKLSTKAEMKRKEAIKYEAKSEELKKQADKLD